MFFVVTLGLLAVGLGLTGLDYDIRVGRGGGTGQYRSGIGRQYRPVRQLCRFERYSKMDAKRRNADRTIRAVGGLRHSDCTILESLKMTRKTMDAGITRPLARKFRIC